VRTGYAPHPAVSTAAAAPRRAPGTHEPQDGAPRENGPTPLRAPVVPRRPRTTPGGSSRSCAHSSPDIPAISGAPPGHYPSTTLTESTGSSRYNAAQSGSPPGNRCGSIQPARSLPAHRRESGNPARRSWRVGSDRRPSAAPRGPTRGAYPRQRIRQRPRVRAARITGENPGLIAHQHAREAAQATCPAPLRPSIAATERLCRGGIYNARGDDATEGTDYVNPNGSPPRPWGRYARRQRHAAVPRFILTPVGTMAILAAPNPVHKNCTERLPNAREG
jgi:hypothetical protein